MKMKMMRLRREALMNRISRFTTRHPFIGPILWVLALQYFAVQLVVAAAWPKPYDWSVNLISDLGAVRTCGEYMDRYVCSPLAPLMNMSFVVFGLTISLGAILIYTAFKRTRVSRLGFILMVVSGVCTVFVGLMPEDVLEFWHIVAAAPALLLGNIAIILFAASLDSVRFIFRYYTYVTGITCVAAFILFSLQIDLGLGNGVMERLVSYPFAVWMMLFGVYMTIVRLRMHL